uniref:RING-type domain-containing protein n=1 Tax=Mesocestoides corti TaxID=53468 RepID=A0A5K3FAV4_MESCO
MRLLEVTDTLFRSLLILFIDAVLAKRISWIFTLKNHFTSWLQYGDTLYSNGISDELTNFFLAIVFLLCSVAVVMPPKQLRILGLLCLPFVLSVAATFVFVRRLNEMVYSYHPWNLRLLCLKCFPIPMLCLLIVFICFRLLPGAIAPPVPVHPDGRYRRLHYALRGFLGSVIIFLPVMLYIDTCVKADRIYNRLLAQKSPLQSTPMVCSYFHVMKSRSGNYLTQAVLQHHSECLYVFSLSNHLSRDHFRYIPELFLVALLFLIALAFICEHLHCQLMASFEEQVRRFLNETFDYVADHWSRLEVPSVFLCFWLIKLTLVIILGQASWPIDATAVEILSRATDEKGMPIKHTLNFTFLSAYANESNLAVTNVPYKMFSRFLTGALAIGAETWTSVYGAAVFVGFLSGIVVNVLAFFVDPLGVNIAQLIETAEAEPVAANPWIPIDEQLTTNEHIEVTAIELLNNTGWSCVVLFVFLAIQYDLPNLTSHQRIFCFTHLLIIMGFTCVYPVESLVKAILLRLGLPGSESSWLDHLIPLLFCGLMLGLSGCVFIYFPIWLSYLPHTGRGYQLLGAKTAAGGISAYTGYAQRLRTYLCGGQLLLDVSCTIFEYVIHQAHRKWPLWTGFTTLLAASRLFNIFVNYLISLLSVFVILWLIFYESFGVCRVFILVVHVFFVLYPATCRGFLWLRTQFLLGGSLAAIPSPTADQLVAYADDCPICYGAMTTWDAKLTQCGHIYHTKCLSQWMRRRPICPMCNTDLFAASVGR